MEERLWERDKVNESVSLLGLLGAEAEAVQHMASSWNLQLAESSPDVEGSRDHFRWRAFMPPALLSGALVV